MFRILRRAILHDEANYPEPFKFNPDRFLTQDGQLNPAVMDPALVVFGFGRRLVHSFPLTFTVQGFLSANKHSLSSATRICAGSHIAASSLWLTIATVLSTLEISQAVDKDGIPIEAELKYEAGSV